ncbi:putative integral membrane protein [Theileria parva strain Muguga]|uniref:Uncharacterized protein n=1 Tax=Theileria parva TaxID=5875 RepID=Q4N6G1_THEPA|nr:putative integral membrane protein [Theileria parva strain Muguga]EAN34447.1 putative integral membrane protein [Theileria parva strain Muguga]|eukprot:XP_766730.1 hypothetical protein [Theileria parva strain Muguga]
MGKKNELFYRRLLIFIHITLVLIILSSGSLAGLYYSKPFIHVGLKYPQEQVNVWHMTSDGDSILTGGNFKTTIAVYNTSVFPITFETQHVDLFYYPIGERPSCMLLHSSDYHFDPMSDSSSISRIYNTINRNNESFFKLSDLKITMGTSGWDFSGPRYKELMWNIGYSVPYAELNTIKRIYMDCVKFERVLFSIQLRANVLNYLFMRKEIESTFELLIPMECAIDPSVHALFHSHNASNEPIIFKNLKHNSLNFNTQ